MTIHPKIVKRNGKKAFVVIPYKEFIAMQEALEDSKDLKILRKEKSVSAAEETVPLDDIIKELDL